MTYYVGDAGPISVPFSIATAEDVDGTDVASVRVYVYRPDGASPREVEWAPSALDTSESEVSFTVTLQSDGSSLPIAGEYYCRAWLYDEGGSLLQVTDEQLLFSVRTRRIVGPTA